MQGKAVFQYISICVCKNPVIFQNQKEIHDNIGEDRYREKKILKLKPCASFKSSKYLAWYKNPLDF